MLCSILLLCYRYLEATYHKFQCFLDGSASLETDTFLKADQELSAFGKRISKLRTQAGELSVLRRTVCLNFIALDCTEVNLLLARRVLELADRIVAFLVNSNKETNRE